MSLVFALKAAVKGTTGPRAILIYGLGRTKHGRRQSGQRPTPRILTPHRRPRERGQAHLFRKFAPDPSSPSIVSPASPSSVSANSLSERQRTELAGHFDR
jgi:hypothetical protein